MADESRGGIHAPKYVCPTCGAVESYGLEQPPDPDRLRDYADDLEKLADQLDSDTPLAARVRSIGGDGRAGE